MFKINIVRSFIRLNIILPKYFQLDLCRFPLFKNKIFFYFVEQEQIRTSTQKSTPFWFSGFYCFYTIIRGGLMALLIFYVNLIDDK